MRRRQRFPTYDPSQRTYRTESMRPWSHRLAWLLCSATVVLLAAGALVTSTGSSLAVPDWPLAYGQLFPPMVGGILYEHGHRLIAALVGLLTIATAGWIWWAEPRRWVRWLAVAALGAVVVQGLLGGITVLLLLPKAVSIGHALLAQGFFLLTVALVQVTSARWDGLVERGRRPLRSRAAPWALATLAALVLELLLGAMVRHFNAGLAIPDFPLAYGRLIPPLSAFPILIHFLHRLGAVVALVLIAGTLWEVRRRHGGDPALRRPATALGWLLALQILLGGAVIWTQRAPTITTLHLVNGALLIATAAVLSLRALVLTTPGGAASRAPTAEASAP
jgi:cytochrome c oxidase assembly protein subunit 15